MKESVKLSSQRASKITEVEPRMAMSLSLYFAIDQAYFEIEQMEQSTYDPNSKSILGHSKVNHIRTVHGKTSVVGGNQFIL